MPVSVAAFATVLALAGTSQPLVSDQSGVITAKCTGSETYQVNGGQVQHSNYELPIRVDLKRGSWCWRTCAAVETQPIADASARPLKLVDLQNKVVSRRDVLDLDDGAFREHYTLDVGTGPVAVRAVTEVIAVCRAETAG